MAHQMTPEERAIQKVIEQCRPHGPTTAPTRRGGFGMPDTWVVSATHVYKPAEPTWTVTVTVTVTQKKGEQATVEVATRPGDQLYDWSVRTLSIELVQQL